ncbi:MAG: hypothetical protein PVI03_07920 [Candidatus Thorarchaeota archaeon]|jgi:hypothetical protein
MAENSGKDYAPIVQCIEDMAEAMAMELVGAEINLLPDGCVLRQDEHDPMLWLAHYPIYRAGEPICIFFYLKDEDGLTDLSFVGAEQGEVAFHLTTDEVLTLEDLWEWLSRNYEVSNEEETEQQESA